MNILKLYVYKGIDRELYFLVHKETWEKVFISCSQNGGQHIGSTISMSLFKKKIVYCWAWKHLRFCPWQVSNLLENEHDVKQESSIWFAFILRR